VRGSSVDIMKLKTLRKKIRRLETRLQAGAKKLAKLKRKLEPKTAVGAGKKKLVSPVRKSRRPSKSSAQKKKRHLTTKPGVKPAGAKRRSVIRRAASEARAQKTPTDSDSTLPEVFQSRSAGATAPVASN
jgi:hypothetical protein